jgi:nitrate/nitrite transporter NarK
LATRTGRLSPRILAYAAIAVVAAIAILVVERKVQFPLVDLALFRSRVFTASIASGLLSYSVLFGTLFIMPFYLQRVLQFGPAQTGLLRTAIPLAIGVLAPISGLLADRLGSRLPTVAGRALAAAGCCSSS